MIKETRRETSTAATPAIPSAADRQAPQKLTKAMIEESIAQQKKTLGDFLGSLFLIGLSLVLVVYTGPFSLIFTALFTLELLIMLFGNKKRKTPKYTVLERACVRKQVKEDDGIYTYELHFDRQNHTGTVSMKVPSPLFEAAQEGELFYLVILHKEVTPCLCYRQAEWIYEE